MKILLSILIGAVSIAAFIGILYVLGYLTIKLNIIEKDSNKSKVAIGTLMVFFLLIMSCVCYIIGEEVLIFIQ